MRNGSFTSSSVTLSSPIALAIVSIPTGPPPKLLIIVSRICLSSLSSPSSSTPRASSALRVTSMLRCPSLITSLKSLALLSSLLPILGVPLDLLASSSSDSSSISIPNTFAERSRIFLISSCV